MPFAATQMDLEIIVLNEVSQWKTNIIYHLICEIQKKGYKWTYLLNRNRLTDFENKELPKGTGEGGMDWDLALA